MNCLTWLLALSLACYSLASSAQAVPGAPYSIEGGVEPLPKKNSFQAKQEALFLVQHPTTLQLTGVRWTAWFGDTVPFLDVELTNSSELPALDVRVSLLDSATGATLQSLKPYKVSESYTQKIVKGTSKSVNGKGRWLWPVASVRDLQAIVHTDCITGAGLDFEPMKTREMEGPSGQYSSGHKLLYLRISYKTIFGQEMSFIASTVIDYADRKSDFMIPRNSNKAVPLTCVGDAGWNTVSSVGGSAS